MTDTLIILAGGASSRMKNSMAVEGLSEEEIKKANATSKALIGFGADNRPILDFLLINAENSGYRNIILVVGEDSEAFQSHYGTRFRELTISYATQFIPEGRSKPYGTADALLQAMEQLPMLKEMTFVVCNSDNLYSQNALSILRNCTQPNALIAYDRDGLDFKEERIAQFAVLKIDAQNQLLDIIEKPEPENLAKFTDSNGKISVSMNIWKILGGNMFSYLENCQPHPVRNEKELPTAVRNFCADHPNGFVAFPLHEHVPDLTSKEDILILKDYLAKYFSKPREKNDL